MPYEMIDIAIVWLVLFAIIFLARKSHGQRPTVELVSGTVGFLFSIPLLLRWILDPTYFFEIPLSISLTYFSLLVAFVVPGIFFMRSGISKLFLTQ